MAHFARINRDNIVTEVIVAEQSFINSGLVGDCFEWVQTSYNTRGGKHYDQENNEDGGLPLRKNYAAIGMVYDKNLDAFYEQQPYNSWTLNEDTCLWEAPVAYPDDGNNYIWNESTTSWDPAPTE